ncbi:hypothetical protein AvCA_47090 [Azotobacter vinelandii CA]|uniref:Uncharacterized protein n=2 Tax=Azotobacter vinelandii TaxID=354 RepID=C1DIZ5_AZOVD|nr:hypothetical protein Avin_47090 [Azotobacter vinelandii DJ]AGK14267.1 hypothetical protein AvCA_47090 [Azotobacter vinelandii CA]AGK22172.1 hypothetical protein AvCA6_47090 [Azotobacter vinelandii CA6]
MGLASGTVGPLPAAAMALVALPIIALTARLAD